jgi:ankyrin repeat protein
MEEKASHYVCIIPFESTLKELYDLDKDMLEQFMRVLIELSEVNVHFIIYTVGTETSKVSALLEEYGPSKYFIPEEDIFNISKMYSLPAINRKYHFINFAINHHNKTWPDSILTPAQVKECVFVLDRDIGYVQAISNPNKKPSYHGIQIEDDLKHITLLEKIYAALVNIEKYSKQHQANNLLSLFRKQNSMAFEDQKLIGLHYHTKLQNIASSIVEGMLHFIKRMSIYLNMVAIFKKLESIVQEDIKKNYQEEVAKIIRNKKGSDVAIEGFLNEFGSTPSLTFCGDEEELARWHKLNDSLCFCVEKYFESKTNASLSRDQLPNDPGILKETLLHAFCLRELNMLAIGLTEIYSDEVADYPHHAQKDNQNKFYWLFIAKDDIAKREKISQALKLYEPLMRKQIDKEIEFLEHQSSTLGELFAHYKKKSEEVSVELHELLDQTGCRDSELQEQRNDNAKAAMTLTQEALFQSVVISHLVPATKKPPGTVLPASFFNLPGNKMEGIRHSRVISGIKGRASSRTSQEMPKRPVDLFDLCRFGDYNNFTNEINSRVSVSYDTDDISLVLRAYINYVPGCSFLLNGIVYKHNHPVCLMPVISYVADSKYNIAKYIDKSLGTVPAGKNDVFDELQLYFVKEPNFLIRLLFPYQSLQHERLIWLVGDIRIKRSNNLYQVEVSAINPYGAGKISETDYSVLCEVLAKQILILDTSATITFNNKETAFSPCLQAGDKASSGIVVTDILIKNIEGNSDTTFGSGNTTRVVNQLRNRYITKLKFCFKDTDPSLVRFLARHFDPNKTGIRKKTLLETALQHGHDSIVGFLVDFPVDGDVSDSGYHPIFSGLLGQKKYPFRINLLRYLLQGATTLGSNLSRGAQLCNVCDPAGNPLLHVAVNHGVARAVETIVKWGVEHPGTVSLYAKNKKNRTAFHETLCASKHGMLRGVLEVLLCYGLGQAKSAIDVLHQDPEVESKMLRFVITFFDGQLHRIQKLNTTQSPRQRTRTGSGIESPRSQRSRAGSFVAMFSSIGSPRTCYEWKGKTLLSYTDNKIPNLTTAELNNFDQGFAPIHVISICGKVELLDQLIKLKVNCNVVTQALVSRKIEGKDDAPELISATRLSSLHLVILCQKKAAEFVAKLLLPGIEISQDSNGCTALHYAVGRDSKAVELILLHLEKYKLLERAKLADKDGVTPLRKALLHADKATVLHFVNVGIWPSQADFMYVESEIIERDNKQEIKQTLCDVFEILKTRYISQLGLILESQYQRQNTFNPS